MDRIIRNASILQGSELRTVDIGIRGTTIAAVSPALEANAREYVPAANRGWEKRYPGIFAVKDGYMATAGLDGPGLCT